MHRYVPNSRPILPPEISWNEVSDLDVILEEIRAYLEKYQPQQLDLNLQDSGGGEESDFNLEPQPQQQQQEESAKIQANEIQKQEFRNNNSKFSESTIIDLESSRSIDQDSRIVDQKQQILNKISRKYENQDQIRSSSDLCDCVGNGGAINGGGGSNPRHHVPPLVARPATLMAAVFPWNHDIEAHMETTLFVESIAEASRFLGDEFKKLKIHNRAATSGAAAVETASNTVKVDGRRATVEVPWAHGEPVSSPVDMAAAGRDARKRGVTMALTNGVTFAARRPMTVPSWLGCNGDGAFAAGRAWLHRRNEGSSSLGFHSDPLVAATWEWRMRCERSAAG